MKRSADTMRLDRMVANRFPEMSRARVRGEIMAGRVLVNGKVCDKPGTPISSLALVEVTAPNNPYLGRGGLKLEGALSDFTMEVKGLAVLDAGASTGGFTDCLLKNGARHVYALDVGYGQLAWPLRQDARVTVMERFNIRSLSPGDLPEKPDLAVADLSFISLKMVLPVLRAARIPAVLALVKPQFEAGRLQANKGRGVIRDASVHRSVLLDIVAFACRIGYCCRALTFSRYPGPQGNLEYFAHWILGAAGRCICLPEIEKQVQALVERAHSFRER